MFQHNGTDNKRHAPDCSNSDARQMPEQMCSVLQEMCPPFLGKQPEWCEKKEPFKLYLLFGFRLKAILECDTAIEYQIVRRRFFGIDAEIACPHKLEM